MTNFEILKDLAIYKTSSLDEKKCERCESDIFPYRYKKVDMNTNIECWEVTCGCRCLYYRHFFMFTEKDVEVFKKLRYNSKISY